MAYKGSFRKERIGDFLEALAKDVPALPAGGCAVALTGALAAALGRMVARLTLRQEKDSNVRKTLLRIQERLEDLQKECVDMMDRDVKEYEGVLQAIQMLRITDHKQAKSEAALQEAWTSALGPPMALAKCGLEMLRLSHGLMKKGYPVVLADAGVAAEMAYACLWGSIWTARSNLLKISSRSFVEQHRKILETLQTEGEGLYRGVRDKLQNRL